MKYKEWKPFCTSAICNGIKFWEFPKFNHEKQRNWQLVYPIYAKNVHICRFCYWYVSNLRDLQRIFNFQMEVCTIFHWNMKQIVSLNLNQSRKINPNSLGKYKLNYAKCKALALKIELQNIKIKYDFRIKCLLFNKKETSLLRDNFLKQYLYCWMDIEYPCAYLWHAKNPIRWKIFTLRWKSFIFYAVVVAGPF